MKMKCGTWVIVVQLRTPAVVLNANPGTVLESVEEKSEKEWQSHCLGMPSQVYLSCLWDKNHSK